MSVRWEGGDHIECGAIIEASTTRSDMDLDVFAEILLKNACPATTLINGNQSIWIESHCVGYWLEVKFDADGGKPVIVSVKQEDC